MNPKLIITILCIVLQTSVQAQQFNFSMYGGVAFNILPSSLKTMTNPAKGQAGPEYGAKLLINLKRFQLGIGYNSSKLNCYQTPAFQRYSSFSYTSDYYSTTSVFHKYQLLANYKFSKTASYLYSGLNVALLQIGKNETKGYSGFLKSGITSSNFNNLAFGAQIGYNENITKRLDIQVESGIRCVPVNLDLMEAIIDYDKSREQPVIKPVTIIQIPITIGLNYKF